MPYKDPNDRKRTKAAKAYGKRPEVLARNRARNKARYEAEKEGRVSKGDGMDIDHIEALSAGGSTSKKNQRIIKAGKNRSFDRNADHSVRARGRRKLK